MQHVLTNFKNFDWHSLTRRRNLHLIEVSLKVLCVAAIVIFLILSVSTVVRNLVNASSSVTKLENTIAKIQQELGTPIEIESEKVDYKSISNSLLLGEISGNPTPKPTETIARPVAQVGLSLIGTYITLGESPYAIIENQKAREQDVFNIGDSIWDVAKLVAVYPNRVEIDRSGSIEVLMLEEGTGSSGGASEESDGDAIKVDQNELDTALENLPLLLTQARAVPFFKDGKAIGLRLFAIKRGSLYEKIGLRNGDILKSINGNSLGDITQAVKLFERLREEKSISVDLIRNRQEQKFTYSIQ